MLCRAWKPGDAPEDHPSWEREVELEIDMMEAGAERFREMVSKARAKGHMTTVKPVKDLVVHWLPLMVHGIKEFLRSAQAASRSAGRGVAPVSTIRLRTFDPALAAYVTLRTVLDAVGAQRLSVVTIAKDIGSALEHEARMDAWQKRDPKLFKRVQASFLSGEDKPAATAIHRRRVNINRFNALMREELAWADWSEHERTRLGLDLIDLLCRYTKRFEIIPDPHHIGRRGKKVEPTYVLAPKAEVLEWIAEKLDRCETMSPKFQPTVIPPRRWQGVTGGGYHTPHIRTPALVRFKAHQEQQRSNAQSEYDALDMPLVYEAIHALQETAWRVNRPVLAVARRMWDADLALAGLPSKEKPVLEERVTGEDLQARRDRKRRNTIAWAEFIKRLARVKAADSCLSIAEKYADEDAIYFPHMLDFRGRLYPIPTHLQPQGDDLARGLLTFAEGKPITEDNGGAGWLAIHVANVYGKDKISNDDRIAWTEAHEAMLRAIAEDPFENRQWCAHGVDHWQALAATFEWVAYLDQGFGYVSHLPIRVDGTCNGIQHLSALVRDEVGGGAVNLTPSDAPRDIYKEVAQPLTERLDEIAAEGGANAEMAEWWLAFAVDGCLPRSLTKRPVMIMPYGGSREAYFKYTREWLAEEHPEVVREIREAEDAGVIEKGTIGRHVAFLVTEMWKIVREIASGGVQTMTWLQACARMAAQGNQPIYWTTPSGFVVRHFYGKSEEKRIYTKLDGREIRVTERVPTKDLDTAEQLKGIAPNFIHSLDASALMSAITSAVGNGVTSVTTIHDAYGTHAADMWVLFKCLRRAFVETHEVDLLGEFRKACVDVYANHIIVSEGIDPEMAWAAFQRADREIPPPLPMGSLDIRLVEESDYFFS